MPMPTFAASELRTIAGNIFLAAGATFEESQIVSEALIRANLDGHDSHGVMRVPEYVLWMEQKLVNVGASMQVVLETDAFALLDAAWGWGQVMGRRAMRFAIEKASRVGAVTISGRRFCHLGRVGDYPAIAAEEGMVAIMFVNTHGGGKLVAPFGGVERRLSANPIAIAVPRSSGGPIVLDISTCAIAEGKLRNMLNGGKPVPANSIIDSKGKPSTDASDFYGPPPGALLPFGGHKGFALGLLTDILAGALSGAGCSDPNVTRIGNAFLVTVIDVGSARGLSAFDEQVSNLVNYVKSSRLAEGVDEILVPGEPELREQARRAQSGIPIDDKTWSLIMETAQRYGVPVAY
jgi:uncharacterized oxidoreductase